MSGFDSSLPNDTHVLNESQGGSTRAALKHLFLRERDPASVYLALAAITLVGFALRILDINKFIAYDEAYTFIHFASRSFKHILADYSAPNNHIFHTILVGISYRLFGAEAWALRLPAFLAGVLIVPATFITARRLCTAPQALGAAATLAVLPVFIDYSVNARGYTMLILFALLLANFGGILVQHQSKSALLAFGLTSVLGFYTIPIFLYPWMGVFLWIVATYLVAGEPWQGKFGKIAVFLGACVLAGMATLILYSPVILFGSGLRALISNEIVESLDWSTFLANLDPRLIKAWNKWMIGIDPRAENLFLGGFLVSLFLYRRVSNQKLPMQVFLVLGVVVLLLLQRVTPLPRIWLYLEAFYLMFAAVGLVWLAEIILRRLLNPQLVKKALTLAVLLLFAGIVANVLLARMQNPAFQTRDRLPEAYAADYLAEHLRSEDTLVATGPVDIQTAYYLSLQEIGFDRFYQRDHPVDIQNAFVLIRKNSKYKTLEDVVHFFQLERELDMSAAELVFEYANVQVYSVPAR